MRTDARTPAVLAPAPLTVMLADARSVSWAPDGAKLAAGLGNPSHSMLVFDTRLTKRQAAACRTLRGHRGAVTQVKFASQNVLVSRSEDGSTKMWDVETGLETAEAVPRGFAFSEQGGAEEQKFNGYAIAISDDGVLFIRSDKKAPDRGPAMAFFQCDDQIKVFDVAGANMAVGLANGQVLQLWAAVLQTPCRYRNRIWALRGV